MLRAAVVLAVAASLLQSQPPAPVFRARADAVQVDVVVVDRDGRHVRGLKPSDFLLRDRRKAQDITTFEEVTHSRPVVREATPSRGVPRDVGTNQIPTADRMVVMVVDDLHIYQDRTDRARAIAESVLDQFAASASMAVLFTSGQNSTRITDDIAVLRGAVATLRGRQSWRRPHAAIDQQRSGRIDAEMSAEQALAVIGRAQEASLQQFFDNMTKYKLLQDAARMLESSDRRRKAFVLISEGIGKELSGLFGAMASPTPAPEGGAEYVRGNLEALAPREPQSYHDFALIDMMEALRRANVATFAIDPRGKVESKDLLRECSPAPRPGTDPCSAGLTDWHSVVRQAQHGLEILSAASGGFAVTNTDDFTSGLDRIVSELDHYYMLGFYPSETKGNGYRTIEVTVPAHPDWIVRYRRGYMGGNRTKPAQTNEMMELSSGILPITDLPLKVSAIALPGSKSAARVALALEVAVPRTDVEERDGRVRDTLKYELLVVDEKKKRVRSLGGREGRLTLSATALGRTPPEIVRYQISETVDLAPGQYEVRWSATSAKLGKGGSVYLPLSVPEFRESPPVLGGIAIGYLEGARVPLAPISARMPAARGARLVTPPMEPRVDVPFAPTLDRIFSATDTIRIYAEGTVRAGVRPQITVEVLDSTGRVVRSPSPSFAVGEAVKIQLALPLEGLTPNPYVLRVTLAAEGRSAVREIGFTIQ
jgi:VWFA-related protein